MQTELLTSLSRPLSTEPVLTKRLPSLPSLLSNGLFSLFGWLRSGDPSVDWLLTGVGGPSLIGISSNFAPRNTGGRDTGRSLRVFGLGGLRSTAGASLAFLRTKYFSPYMKNKQTQIQSLVYEIHSRHMQLPKGCSISNCIDAVYAGLQKCFCKWDLV